MEHFIGLNRVNICFIFLTEDHHFTDDQAVPRTLIIIDGLVAKTTYSVTIYAVSAAGNGLAVENPWTTKPLSKFFSLTLLMFQR